VAAGSTYVTYYLQNHGSVLLDARIPRGLLLFANGQSSSIRYQRSDAYSLVQLKAANGPSSSSAPWTIHPGTGCSTSWRQRGAGLPPNQTTSIQQPAHCACELTVGPVSAV